MKYRTVAFLIAMALSALSCGAQAQAQAAYTAKTVNLRAGPARDYPIVAVVPGGLQISVQGCLEDYSWCDVIAGPSRGWVFAGNINYFYQNTYVPLIDYGPVVGIAVLGFILDDYWGRHYRNRPFFAERNRWEGRVHSRPPRFATEGQGHMVRRPRPQPAVPLQTRPRGTVQAPSAGRGSVVQVPQPVAPRLDAGAQPGSPAQQGRAVRRARPPGHEGEHDARPARGEGEGRGGRGEGAEHGQGHQNR